MAPSDSTSMIPKGYTFLNHETIISTKAEEVLVDLLQKADNRNPDLFRLYIYNDFFAYGLLDLVDKTTSTLHSRILKKNWDEAFVILEALTLFNDTQSSWPMCDDGERTELTNKVYGASLVTVLRALKEDGRLDAAHFPSLETLLRNAASWGGAMKRLSSTSHYNLVCKAIGRRLFKNKPDGIVHLEKAWRDEWIKGLEAEDQAAVKEAIKEDEEEIAKAAAEGDVKEPWYVGGKASDEDDDDEEYVLSRVWKEYKAHLATVPNKPMRGPANWNINKWSAAQKKPFEWGGSDSDF